MDSLAHRSGNRQSDWGYIVKSEFTPGPWTTKKIDDGVYDICRCGNDGLRTRVCRLHASQIEPEHGGTIEANAQLIAAAPELLAALQLVYANAGESPEWIRARIDSAISKAEDRA